MTPKSSSTVASTASTDSFTINVGDYVKYDFERVFEDVAVSVRSKGAGYVERIEKFRPRPYYIRVGEQRSEWVKRDEIVELVAEVNIV